MSALSKRLDHAAQFDRASVDRYALILRFHNRESFVYYCRAYPGLVECLTFYERLRLDILGMFWMAGIAHNLIRDWLCHYTQYLAVQPSTQTVFSDVPYVLLNQLTGMECFIEAMPNETWWKTHLMHPRLARLIDGLRYSIAEQNTFLSLIVQLLGSLTVSERDNGKQEWLQPHNFQPKATRINGELDLHSDSYDVRKIGRKPEAAPQTKDFTTLQDQSFLEDCEGLHVPLLERTAGLSFLNSKQPIAQDDNNDTQTNINPNQALCPHTRGSRRLRGAYHVYTKQFDEVVSAKTLSTSQERQRLYRSLRDFRSPELHSMTQLIRRLKQLIYSHVDQPNRLGSDGVLNSNCLAQLIAQPKHHYVSLMNTPTQVRRAAVSILIDNSGSMSGAPIRLAAWLADALVRHLEGQEISIEVLGYTTKSWKGGEAYNLWNNRGAPKNPGRLNDLRHIVYKKRTVESRRHANSLGVMLKEGVLKENIDGEAIEWACQRLTRCSEQKKILIVLSDGLPVDETTQNHNSKFFLENHLSLSLQRIRRMGTIELVNISLGRKTFEMRPRIPKKKCLTGLARRLSEKVHQTVQGI